MLIGKFNKMIRNRWLWGFFAAIVSVIFIFSSCPGSGGNRDDATRSRSAGSLYGEDISNQVFERARLFELQLDTSMQLTLEQGRALRKGTWRRLAVLQAARQMGVTVSDEEVKEALRQDQTFWDGGVFNDGIFQRQVSYRLRKFQNPVRLYWDFTKEEIQIRKVITLLDSFVWIAPYETDCRLHNILDSFVVEYAVLDFDPDKLKVELSQEDAEVFYAQNREFFTVPEHIKVRYVAFSISNYLADAEVRDDEVSDYYHARLDDYTVLSTNGTNVNVHTQLLADVSEDILLILKRHGAAFEAKSRATDFVLDVSDRPDVTLDGAAQVRGFTVTTTDYFTAGDDIPGVDISYAFYILGRDFDPKDSGRNISDALTGEDSVYVISTVDKRPAYIPEFSQITNEVIPLAYSNAVRMAFVDKAQNIRKTMQEETSKGVAFSDSMTGFALSVSTSTPFSVGDGLSTNDPPYLEALFSQISLLTTGEVTEVTHTEDGDALFAYVKERTAGDSAAMQWYAGRLVNMMSYHRIGLLYERWSDYLLEKADHKDYSVLPPEPEPSPDAADSANR